MPSGGLENDLIDQYSRDRPRWHARSWTITGAEEALGLWGRLRVCFCRTVRRHRHDGAFHDLEQCLLHAFARDVAGDRGVVGLAADLVDLVDLDDKRGGISH
jgi:hypothetical protein